MCECVCVCVCMCMCTNIIAIIMNVSHLQNTEILSKIKYVLEK